MLLDYIFLCNPLSSYKKNKIESVGKGQLFGVLPRS
jgi:hypothetical protein